MRHVCLALVLSLLACNGGRGGADEQAGPARVVSGAPASQTEAHEAEAEAAQAKVVLSPPGRDPVVVPVELARTPDERRLGLMHRTHLDAEAGMLFLFEAPSALSFWMRNTLIPLDMIFIESDMTILGIVENAEPQTDTSRRVPGLSQYVLEVNAGFARSHGLGPGTPVRFDGVEGF